MQCDIQMQCGSLFVQGHMAIMGNVCIPVLLVTLLIAVSSYEACILSCLMCTWTNLHIFHIKDMSGAHSFLAHIWQLCVK